MILSRVTAVPRQILYLAKIILVTWSKHQDKRVQKISMTRPRQDKITNSWSCLGLSTGGKSDHQRLRVHLPRRCPWQLHPRSLEYAKNCTSLPSTKHHGNVRPRWNALRWRSGYESRIHRSTPTDDNWNSLVPVVSDNCCHRQATSNQKTTLCTINLQSLPLFPSSTPFFTP